MIVSVLHIAHYAATYRGNFIASLEELEKRVIHENGKMIYMFPEWTKGNGAETWIRELKNAGKEIYYFSGNTLKDMILIRKIVRKYRVNVVHTHFLPAKYQIAVKLACREKESVQVVHFHNHSEKKSGIESFLRKQFYRNSVMVSCGKSVYKSVCRDYPVNKKYQVDNGIDPDRLTEFKILTSQELGIENNDPICLMYGFDFLRKGVDLACLAIQKLWEEGIRVNLLISLSSNYDEVKNRIQALLGKIPQWLVLMQARSDVASLYHSVDIFMSPSREEGLPYSVLEACYSPCAVVLSDIEAQKLDLPYTYWFQSENVNALSEVVRTALEKRKEKEMHLEEIRSEIMLKYSVSSWAEQMLKIYQAELERGNSYE